MDPSASSGEDTGPVPVQIQWSPVIDAIKAAVRVAFDASPPYDASSPPTFNTYWHDVFTRLADTVASDRCIPQHLTNPAVTRFDVTLYEASGAGMCPCCLLDSYPDIELENEDGVSKTDLVLGLRDCLYGNTGGDEIDGEGEEDEGEEEGEGGRVVFAAEWMYGLNEGPGGEKYTHRRVYGEKADDVVNIWVFWETVEGFAERVREERRKDEEERKKTGEQGGGKRGRGRASRGKARI